MEGLLVPKSSVNSHVHFWPGLLAHTDLVRAHLALSNVLSQIPQGTEQEVIVFVVLRLNTVPATEHLKNFCCMDNKHWGQERRKWTPPLPSLVIVTRLFL